jgi:hypothetical protein
MAESAAVTHLEANRENFRITSLLWVKSGVIAKIFVRLLSHPHTGTSLQFTKSRKP